MHFILLLINDLYVAIDLDMIVGDAGYLIVS